MVLRARECVIARGRERELRQQSAREKGGGSGSAPHEPRLKTPPRAQNTSPADAARTGMRFSLGRWADTSTSRSAPPKRTSSSATTASSSMGLKVQVE